MEKHDREGARRKPIACLGKMRLARAPVDVRPGGAVHDRIGFVAIEAGDDHLRHIEIERLATPPDRPGTRSLHQVRDRTVLRQDLEGLPASSRLALDLLSGFEGVEKAFEVSSCGERCLVLTPREPRPDLLRVLVEVGESLGDVVVVTTEDSLGNRTRVALKDVRRNEGVPDETFSFRPPEGVQVLEMGAGEGGGR